MKIYVYAIAKNESQFVDRWLDSMLEADGIIVLDTGSEDDTVKRLRSRGAMVWSKEIDPWRFDVARNTALDLVPLDADICVCTDLDEVLDTGWRDKLEAAWVSGTTDAKYCMNFDFKPDGTPGTQYFIAKAHARQGFTWKWPCHEYLVSDKPRQTVVIPELYINHLPDPTKLRSSYLALLEMAVEESPDDARMVYYLGREYKYEERWQDCIDTFKRYLDLQGAWWKEERCAAMRFIAESFKMLSQVDMTRKWYHNAIAECPTMREPYADMAILANDTKDWLSAYFYSKAALKITEKSQTFINEWYVWNFRLDDIAALACWHLGYKDEALMHARRALEMAPDNKRLKENVKTIEKLINKSEGIIAKKKRVLIGSPVCQSPKILKEFLDSLKAIDLSSLDVAFLLVDDNQEQVSSNMLRDANLGREKILISAPPRDIDFEISEVTHYWNYSLVLRVANLKNEIIKYAVENDYEYLFLIDSDVLVTPLLIKHLLAQEKDIISEIYWTRWQPDTIPMPNAWLYDDYKMAYPISDSLEFDQKEDEFLEKLKVPGVYKVGGLGACTLLSVAALKSGLSFSPMENVSFWGEDRWFCIRAVALGYQLFVDTHYPAKHLYRESDINT